MRRLASVLLVAATVLPWIADAAPGDLDPEFGSGGFVATDFAGVFDVATSLVLQPDGKIVAAGRTDAGGSPNFGLARYGASGALDAAFGSGGLVTTDAGGFEILRALALQPDGKLVAVGRGGSPDGSFVLARYDTDGTLDSSFGTAGIVTTTFGAQSSAAEAVVVQPDGKLVVAGRTTFAASSDLALARYNADGTLDAAFGSGGLVTTDFAGGSDLAHALVLQPDGKLVAAGEASVAGSAEFALARYDADGTPDATFGSGGSVTTDIPQGADRVWALVRQKDGRLLAAGVVENQIFSNFVIARYEADGTLDGTFGSSGVAITDFPGSSEAARALVVQPDGKLLAAGHAAGPGGFTDIALARYDTTGALDPTFGSAGLVTTDLGTGRPDQASAAVLQPDGKLLVAGSRSTTMTTDFAVARYLAVTHRDVPTLPALGSLLLAGALALVAGRLGLRALGSENARRPRADGRLD